MEAVIKALGLTRCRDTIIGDHLRRGVSGAQRLLLAHNRAAGSCRQAGVDTRALCAVC